MKVPGTPLAANEAESERNAKAARAAGTRTRPGSDAETGPPRYVIHTVHGTFANKAAWPEEDSRLGTHLRASLGGRVKIIPFRWSGSNRFAGRQAASIALQERLRASLDAEDCEDADHFVIAHSHGGNVAFMALYAEDLCDRISGVVTMGTPFLSASVRRVQNLIDPGTALFAALFGGWAVLFYGMYRGQGWSLWPWAVAAFLAILGLILSGAFALELMKKHAGNICASIADTRLRADQVAVIRHQLDEAAAALSGARLAGTLTNLVWRGLTAGLFERVNSLLSLIDYGKFRSSWQESKLAARMEQARLLAQLEPDQGRSDFGEYLDRQAAISGSKPWYREIVSGPILAQAAGPLLGYLLYDAGPETQFWTMLAAGLFALPAVLAVALVLLAVPAAVLSALSLLPCGWSAPLAGPYLSLAAEPTPPGTWTVTSFESAGESSGLFHSRAYNDEAVLSFIVDWIKARNGSGTRSP